MGNPDSMKSHRPFHPRITPLAASLSLLLGAVAMPHGAAAGDRVLDAQPVSPRYALRQQQRAARAARVPAAHHAPSMGAGTTRTVTTCSDDLDDPGNLRNVLASAAEGDTIDLSALTCSTITLVNGPLDTSVLGEHHLYDVTLQGPGRDALTIDAAGL